MTDMDLKPCPFCGGSVHQQGFDNVIKCDACGVTICIPMSDKQEEAFEQGLVFGNWDIAHVAEFWSARAERTCRNNQDYDSEEFGHDFRCSLCGFAYDEADETAMRAEWIRYCPGCGAKVVW